MESNVPSPIKAEQITRQIPRERFIFSSVQLTHSSGISQSTAAHSFTLRQKHWTSVQYSVYSPSSGSSNTAVQQYSCCCYVWGEKRQSGEAEYDSQLRGAERPRPRPLGGAWLCMFGNNQFHCFHSFSFKIWKLEVSKQDIRSVKNYDYTVHTTQNTL